MVDPLRNSQPMARTATRHDEQAAVTPHAESVREVPNTLARMTSKLHNLLADGIYQKLNEMDGPHQTFKKKLPNKTSSDGVGKLMTEIERRLGDTGNPDWSGTRFDAIKRNGYQLALSSRQTVNRTQEEAELHILLQTNFSIVANRPLDRADSLEYEFVTKLAVEEFEAEQAAAQKGIPETADRTQLILAAHPGKTPAEPKLPASGKRVAGAGGSSSGTEMTRLPVSNARPALPAASVSEQLAVDKKMTDHRGNLSVHYGPEVACTEKIEEKLDDKSCYRIVHIPANSNNCWLHAAVLSALIQRTPAELEKTLVKELGRKFKKHAATLRREGDQMLRNGVFSNNAAYATACAAIAKPLLEKAKVDANEIKRSFDERRWGSEDCANTLLRILDCDAIVFSEIQEYHGQGKFSPADINGKTLLICSSQHGKLSELGEGEVSREERAKRLIDAIADLPVQIHTGGHFNLAIPRQKFNRV